MFITPNAIPSVLFIFFLDCFIAQQKIKRHVSVRSMINDDCSYFVLFIFEFNDLTDRVLFTKIFQGKLSGNNRFIWFINALLRIADQSRPIKNPEECWLGKNDSRLLEK